MAGFSHSSNEWGSGRHPVLKEEQPPQQTPSARSDEDDAIIPIWFIWTVAVLVTIGRVAMAFLLADGLPETCVVLEIVGQGVVGGFIVHALSITDWSQ